MCLYPRHVHNRRYIPNMKNGGTVPQIPDRRLLSAPIPCGRCMECKKQKYNEWRIRIIEELKHDKDALFVTLTLSTQSLKDLVKDIHKTRPDLYGYDLDNAIATTATKRFLDRIKHSKRAKSVKHWLVTELGHGETEHLHLHGFLWTADKTLLDRWNYGMTWVGSYATGKTASYVTKYILKTDNTHREYKPIILCSPGIGKAYLDTRRAKEHRYKPGETREQYVAPNGQRSALPKYYRQKIYTEREREALWLEKLEKEKQYVLGEEVSTQGKAYAYLDAIKIARMKNHRLGYGTSRTNTNRKQYEQNMREKIQRKRLDTQTTKPDNDLAEPNNQG
ncbi:MAG: replication initiator protein [Microviridae sp.]|nr:MAG: replication initiator protein [Microviridae sp.]